MDLDPQAVEIARLNLLIRALAQRELLPSLEDNIQCGNSLVFGKDEELEKLLGSNFKDCKPLNWDDKFGDIIKSGGFDIIIGNPPYVMELRDNKDIFRQLRATPLGIKYYEPKMDLFYFFIELGIDLLKPGGYLGFIVQQYWVSRTHASKLRQKVFAETCPLALVDFGEYQVFRDAPGQSNMITVFKKSEDKDTKTLTLKLKDAEVSEQTITKALASDVLDQEIFEARTIYTSQLFDDKTDKVYVIGDTVSAVLAKLDKNSWKLEDDEIQVGADVHQPFLRSKVISKLDNPESHKAGEGIFVLTKAEVNKLKLKRNEERLLRPFHYAEEIDSYLYSPDVKFYLIYTPVEIAEGIESNPNKYPNIRSHLDEYQPVITSDHKPYGIHRARQPEWFEDPKKIICVRKTKYPKCVAIPEPWYGDQAVLIIRLVKHMAISRYFVVSILNSKVAHFWLFQQKRQGNQLQVDKEVLLYFPFRKIDLSKAADKEIHNRIITLAIKVGEKKMELALVKSSGADIFGEKSKEFQGAIQKMKHEIDQLVFKLYRLTEDEIRQIDSVACEE